MSGFTTQQQKALETAYASLGEHFDGVVICVLANCGDDKPQEGVRSYYYGGRMQAIGLLEEAKHRLLEAAPDSESPSETDGHCAH